MKDIDGTYSLERNENLDEYFSKVGLPYLARKMMLSTSPTLTISHDGDKWKINIKTMMMNMTIDFKLGEKFEESMPNGEKFKSTAEIVGNSLVIRSKGMKQGETERHYALEGDKLVMTMRNVSHNCEARRIFKRN